MPSRLWGYLCAACVLTACSDPLLNRLPEIASPNDTACLDEVTPQNLRAVVYMDRVELTWESTADSAYQMIVQRRRTDEAFGTLDRLAGDARTFTDATCITRNSWCEYTVQAVRSDCQAPVSSSVRAYTFPFAPSNATVLLDVAETTVAVTLTFSDTNVALASYVVARRDASSQIPS